MKKTNFKRRNTRRNRNTEPFGSCTPGGGIFGSFPSAYLLDSSSLEEDRILKIIYHSKEDMTEFSSIIPLLGDKLVTKDGERTTGDLLNGKYIGLYFSAHWCPPCRRFTPELSKFYQHMVAKGVDLEIVFVSSDRDQASFDEYYGEMPWKALPFAEREKKTSLSKKFKVKGIPMLVILDTEGNVITTNGTTKVSEDAEGNNFPWYPTTFAEDIGTTFLGKDGATVPSSSFVGKYLGIYFSAHWCPPCRNFTPKLVDFYNKRKESGKDDFEVIFSSADEDQTQFNEYFAEMPWLALPFQDERGRSLDSRFEVQGYPMLVVVDPNGNLVTSEGRGAVESDPKGLKFPWFPEPVKDISATIESYGANLQEVPSIIAFVESLDDGDQADALAALTAHAIPLSKDKADTPDGPEMLFFISTKPSQMASRIKQLLSIQDDSVQLALLNLSEGNYSLLPGPIESIDADIVGSFIEAFRAGALDMVSLSPP